MLRHHIGTLLLWTLTLAAGCSSPVAIDTRADPQADFASFRTFAWAGGAPAEVPGMRPETRAAIIEAVQRNLAARGLALGDPSAADLLVAYGAMIDEQTDVSSTPRMRYRGSADAGWETWAHTSKVGTLVVDVVDRRTGRSVWRGAAEEDISAGVTREEIDEAVGRMFDHWGR